MEIIALPKWIRKGAQVLLHSSVFGFIKVVITSVSHAKITYEAELHNRNYDCAISYQSLILMINSGEVRPC